MALRMMTTFGMGMGGVMLLAGGATSILTAVSMGVSRQFILQRRKASGQKCTQCAGEGKVPCRLCNAGGTINFSPFASPNTRIAVCPTCTGSRKQKCLNCIGDGYSRA